MATHRMTCTLVNQTNYNIAFRSESYFDPGYYNTAPTNLPANTSMQFSVTGSEGGGGVSGGARFYLIYNNIWIPFAAGFAAPSIDVYKAGAAGPSDKPNSPSAEDGYKAISGGGNAVLILSPTPDKKAFSFVATPGIASQFVLSEWVNPHTTP